MVNIKVKQKLIAALDNLILQVKESTEIIDYKIEMNRGAIKDILADAAEPHIRHKKPSPYITISCNIKLLNKED